MSYNAILPTGLHCSTIAIFFYNSWFLQVRMCGGFWAFMLNFLYIWHMSFPMWILLFPIYGHRINSGAKNLFWGARLKLCCTFSQMWYMVFLLHIVCHTHCLGCHNYLTQQTIIDSSSLSHKLTTFSSLVTIYHMDNYNKNSNFLWDLVIFFI